MNNLKPMRINGELYNLISERKRRFGTTLAKEQKNILTIINDVETTIGINMKEIPIINGKPQIKPKKNLWVLGGSK